MFIILCCFALPKSTTDILVLILNRLHLYHCGEIFYYGGLLPLYPSRWVVVVATTGSHFWYDDAFDIKNNPRGGEEE